VDCQIDIRKIFQPLSAFISSFTYLSVALFYILTKPYNQGTNVHKYGNTGVSMKDPIQIERMQTGMRIEKRMVKVLKALAEYLDMTLGDLIEGIVLHAFDGKVPFNETTLKKIKELKKVYELELDSTHSHKLTELNGL